MSKTYRDHAVVLRHYKLGEADRIIVALTQHHGQVRAVVKGVRRTTSRFGARVEPLNVIDAQFYRGRGDLDTLTQVDVISPLAARLCNNYDAFTHAHVMADVAEKLSAVDTDSADHFEILYGALGALAAGERSAEHLMVAYMLRALAIAGWPPRLDMCGHCNAHQPPQYSLHNGTDTNATTKHSSKTPSQGHQRGTLKRLDWFSVAHGGAYCHSCHPLDAVSIDPYQLATLQALLDAQWDKVGPLESRVVHLVIKYAQWYIEHRMKSIDVLAQGA